jgi:hypothetical protein
LIHETDFIFWYIEHSKASFAQDIKPEDELRREAPQLVSWILVYTG